MSALETVEARAYAAMAEAAGGSARSIDGGICLRAPIAATELNRVVAVADGLDLDAVAAAYDRPHLVCVPPWVTSLDRALAERGYAPARPWVKFARGTAPLPHRPSGLRIDARPDAAALAATLAEGFGLPPDAAPSFAFLRRPGFHGFVALDGDEPVGGAAMYVHREHAWLGAAATRPAFRGRGAQTVLIAARIERARALGVTTVTVETGAHDGEPGPSYRNILRAGFTERYTRPNWLSAR